MLKLGSVLIDQSIYLLISGPELPVDNLYGSTMVPSPTGNGVVVIGGMTNTPTLTNTLGFECSDNNSLSTTTEMLELSGDYIDRLQWTTLDQELKYERAYSLAFPIPDRVVADLEMTKLNSGRTGVTDCHVVHSAGHGTMGARTPTDFEKYGENTEVRCKLCGDKYPYNHIESHVVGVHGLDGPIEMYTDDQTGLVRLRSVL